MLSVMFHVIFKDFVGSKQCITNVVNILMVGLSYTAYHKELCEEDSRVPGKPHF